MFNRAYIEITNVCNLHCDFCPGTSRAPRAMTVREFRVIAEKLRDQTAYLYLHVMGEPLGHSQLQEILTVADELGFCVCLTTNGTLLKERLPVLLSSPCVHKVSVSLHSFEGNGCADGLSAYLSAVWDGCLALSGSGVLCALRLWNEGGRDACNDAILSFLSRQIGCDITALPLDPLGHRRLREGLFLESARRFDWPHPEAESAGTQFCYGLRRQLAVLCDGTVVPCCLDSEGRLALGNLLQQDLADILASPRAAALREGFSRRQPSEDLCRRCSYAARFNR